MKAVRVVSGRAVPLGRSRRRHRPDHPQRLAQAGRAHRLRQGPVLRVARRPVVRAQRRALRRRHHPPGGPELRHRLVARARRVGDHGLRLRGRGLAPLRRHLPQQLPPRTGSCRWSSTTPRRRRLLAAVEADPTLEITVDVERLDAVGPGAGHRGAVPARPGHAGALPRGPRRHRHLAAPRRRHRPLRDRKTRLDAHHRRSVPWHATRPTCPDPRAVGRCGGLDAAPARRGPHRPDHGASVGGAGVVGGQGHAPPEPPAAHPGAGGAPHHRHVAGARRRDAAPRATPSRPS